MTEMFCACFLATHTPYRVIPQINKTTHTVFLRDLAVEVLEETRFNDKPSDVAEFASKIMSEAIQHTNFNTYQQKARSDSQLASLANWNQGKAYLNACLGRFLPQTTLILKQMASVQSLPPDDVQMQIKNVLLPSLELLAEFHQKNPDVPTPPSIFKYLRWTLEGYMHIFVNKQPKDSWDDMRRVVRASTLPGGTELLIELYVFTVCSESDILDSRIPLSIRISPHVDHLSQEQIRLIFIETLHFRSPRFLSPRSCSESGPGVKSLVSRMLRRYSCLARPKTSRQILLTMTLYLELRHLAPEYHEQFIGRLVEDNLLAIDTVLVPMIPDIRALAVRYERLGDFSRLFRDIMLTWLEQFLVRKPESSVPGQISSALKALCTCTDCLPIREFFTSNPHPTLVMPLTLGALWHAESSLNQCAKSICKWSVPNDQSQVRVRIISLSCVASSSTLMSIHHGFRSKNLSQFIKRFYGKFNKRKGTRS